MNLKILFLATRPWSFIMTLLSPTISLLLAYQSGVYDLMLFPLVVVGLIAFHGAANMINDLLDVRYGVDRYYSPTSKYRRHYLLIGEISVSTFLYEILFFYIIVVSITVYLTFIRGWIIPVFTVLGLFFAYAYSGEPFKLKHKPLGELSAFLVWGPFMTTGTYYILTSRLSLAPLYASIPIGMFVALVIFANNLREIDYDKAAGVKTLAVILGKKRALSFYKYFLSSIYFSLILLVISSIYSAYTLIAYLTLPKAIRLVRAFYEKVPEAADLLTAQQAFNFGILIILGETLHYIQSIIF